MRDNLGLIESADEVGALAAEVEDAGGMYIVPAFSGLFAPHWRADARGVMVGLTRYIDRRHISRAALEAYATHPAHVAAGRDLVAICAGGAGGIIVFDLEA